MNTRGRYALVLALVLLGGVALVAIGRAAPAEAPLTQGGAPAVMAYQGEVRVDGAPYSGDGHFKFAVVDSAGSTTTWSNDGTSGFDGLEALIAFLREELAEGESDARARPKRWRGR